MLRTSAMLIAVIHFDLGWFSVSVSVRVILSHIGSMMSGSEVASQASIFV